MAEQMFSNVLTPKQKTNNLPMKTQDRRDQLNIQVKYQKYPGTFFFPFHLKPKSSSDEVVLKKTVIGVLICALKQY